MTSDQKQLKWTTPRVHRRFILDLRVVVRGPETLHGRTKDISEGGMGATIPCNLTLGQIVQLQLTLPDLNENLIFTAELRYRQGFQYGFKFLHPTERQRDIIRRITRDLPLAP